MRVGARDLAPRAPRYGSRCLDVVLPAAATAIGVSGFDVDLRIPRAHSVALLFIDGLGWRQLLQHSELAPTICAMAAVPGAEEGIDASFPTTTPVSLATLGTGMPPGLHGIVGPRFWLPEENKMLLPLSWGSDPRPEVVQPHDTVLDICEQSGVATTQVGPRMHAGTGLTIAALGGRGYAGADTLGEKVAEAVSAARHLPALFTVYYGELDKVGHIHGVDSEHWRAELQEVDRFVDLLLRSLPSGTTVLLTSDHGMMDCPQQQRVDVEQPHLRQGVRKIGGEPRMRQVYLRGGEHPGEVAQRWGDWLGDRAEVVTRDDAVAAGLFGTVAPEYRGRIGDVLAIAAPGVRLASDRVDATVSALPGQHGGLTSDEVLVPLLIRA